jgi:hypothetical protein
MGERRFDWRHREHSSLSRNEVRAYGLFLGQKERTLSLFRESIGGIESEAKTFFSVEACETNRRRTKLGTGPSFGHGHHPCQKLTALRGESIGDIESTLACPGTKLEPFSRSEGKNFDCYCYCQLAMLCALSLSLSLFLSLSLSRRTATDKRQIRRLLLLLCALSLSLSLSLFLSLSFFLPATEPDGNMHAHACGDRRSLRAWFC